MATKASSPRPETLATALLEQLASVNAEKITPETAAIWLNLHLEPEFVQDFQDLSARARAGALDDADQEKLDEYIRVADLLAILQSRARQVMKRIGHSD